MEMLKDSLLVPKVHCRMWLEMAAWWYQSEKSTCVASREERIGEVESSLLKKMA